MPIAPLRACGRCGAAGCLCGARAGRDLRERARPSARQRGYGARWDRARKAYLARHPLCVLCEESKRITVADTVDHIIPHKGHEGLFWSETNWQPVCWRCHSRKTATTDGGFGRARVA